MLFRVLLPLEAMDVIEKCEHLNDIGHRVPEVLCIILYKMTVITFS